MMDCQHIRTAIETASRYEPMGETAQRHLRSCDGCREYADEMSSFLSLLKSTPRVTAPADFDFRLRARIAEAQAKRRNPFSFLDGLRSMSFSWGQTATAMATVALVATLATFYFVRQTPTSQIGIPDKIAKVTPAPKLDSPISAGIASQPVTQDAITQTIASTSSASNSHVRNAMRNAGGKRTEQLELPTDGQANLAVAGTQIMVSPPRGGAPRLVTVSPYTYGAQPAAKRSDNTLAISQVIF